MVTSPYANLCFAKVNLTLRWKVVCILAVPILMISIYVGLGEPIANWANAHRVYLGGRSGGPEVCREKV